MSGLFTALLRPALFCLDAEMAHGFGIKTLKSGLLPSATIKPDSRLAVSVAGLNFPNPLGMAAGFDKNAEVPDALLRLGFGFTEVGTITPYPQTGNPKPRVFRLKDDQAVINRLGFNNSGHVAALAHLSSRKGRTGIIGVNIGANKDSADRIGDYVLGIRHFVDVANYFTVNISSPNTPGLRDLQTRSSLGELLAKVMAERSSRLAMAAQQPPIFLKIAPDLAEGDLEDIAAEVIANKVEGVIVSNTTLSRTGLKSQSRNQSGGLSGVPLFERSTIVLAKMRRLLGNDIALIGVGGINSAASAFAKIEAGADLVQLYTGFIYEGPGLPAAIIGGLSNLLDREGLKSIAQVKGRTIDVWAQKPLIAE